MRSAHQLPRPRRKRHRKRILEGTLSHRNFSGLHATTRYSISIERSQAHDLSVHPVRQRDKGLTGRDVGVGFMAE